MCQGGCYQVMNMICSAEGDRKAENSAKGAITAVKTGAAVLEGIG